MIQILLEDKFPSLNAVGRKFSTTKSRGVSNFDFKELDLKKVNILEEIL